MRAKRSLVRDLAAQAAQARSSRWGRGLGSGAGSPRSVKGWKLRMEAQGRAERALERAMAPSAAAAESEASARAKDWEEEAGAGMERREAVGADQQQDVEADASVRDGQDMRSPLPRCDKHWWRWPAVGVGVHSLCT